MVDFRVALRTLTVARRPPSGGWPTFLVTQSWGPGHAPVHTLRPVLAGPRSSHCGFLDRRRWGGGGWSEQDGLRHCLLATSSCCQRSCVSGWLEERFPQQEHARASVGRMSDNLLKKSEKPGWWKSCLVFVDTPEYHADTLYDVLDKKGCKVFCGLYGVPGGCVG